MSDTITPTIDDVKRLAVQLDFPFVDYPPRGFALIVYSSGAGDYYEIENGGIPLAYQRLQQLADARKQFAQNMAPYELGETTKWGRGLIPESEGTV